MNREELQDAIQKIADEKNIDLTKNWSQKSEENLQKYLDELNGGESKETVTVPVVAKVVTPSHEVSASNPYGEEIMKMFVPIDKSNPKLKVFTFSINGKRLVFPLGKMAHMPLSYYLGYLDSQTTEMQAQLKQSENHYKEI